VDSGCCEQHGYRSAKELRAGINGNTGEEAEIAASHGKDQRRDSRFSGLVQYLKCAAAHLRYLGIEVDDALEIAEQTEV
jgi:hypothetical protein